MMWVKMCVRLWDFVSRRGAAPHRAARFSACCSESSPSSLGNSHSPASSPLSPRRRTASFPRQERRKTVIFAAFLLFSPPLGKIQRRARLKGGAEGRRAEGAAGRAGRQADRGPELHEALGESAPVFPPGRRPPESGRCAFVGGRLSAQKGPACAPVSAAHCRPPRERAVRNRWKRWRPRCKAPPREKKLPVCIGKLPPAQKPPSGQLFAGYGRGCNSQDPPKALKPLFRSRRKGLHVGERLQKRR